MTVSVDDLLVVAAPGRDRRLLADWLAGTGSYGVTVLDPTDCEDDLPEYDVAVLDETALERCGGRLLARRRAADPVYLPHLLVGATELPDDDAGRELVDDVVALPVRQGELERRLENLLRARRTALRLSNVRDQYERLVELTPETILLVRDGEIVYANETGAELLGFDDGDTLRGERVTEFVVPDDRPALETALETVDRDGRLSEYLEVTLSTATGRELPAEVAGVTVTYEGVPTAQFLVRDLSEQRRRRQRLTLMSRAVEAAAQGITVADARRPDEPLVYANEAFERLTGYDRQGVLGRNCRFLQGEGTDPETVARLRQAIDDERPVSVELLNYRKDGTPFWNRLDVVPIRNDGGEVTHYLGLQQDVTERRTREERLAVLDRVLRHNIRNRTNVIGGTARLLLEAERDGDDASVDQAASLERIVDASEELQAISEQAREFQTIVGDEENERQRVELTDVLERITAEATGVFELHLPDEPVVVSAHPKLPAALSAGLSLPSATTESGTDLRVDLSREDDMVTLSVTDRGGTIPQSDLEAVAAERETAIEHSRGMELWVVRWTVLASDGEMTVSFDDDDPTVHVTLHAAE
ncbi:PAS domain-containing protein [Halobaculum sp. MBLA0143]|uniref:PAS domain-containing protein n=1 Tax=Halobaculum sp. MBLA0143 TaxID=3079933 RepID=UPI003523125B